MDTPSGVQNHEIKTQTLTADSQHFRKGMNVTDVFTDTPPTEPGFYWLKDREGKLPNCIGMCSSVVGKWMVQGCQLPTEAVLKLVQFGPRIPSIEQLAELQAKAWKWDWIRASPFAESSVEIAEMAHRDVHAAIAHAAAIPPDKPQ